MSPDGPSHFNAGFDSAVGGPGILFIEILHGVFLGLEVKVLKGEAELISFSRFQVAFGKD